MNRGTREKFTNALIIEEAHHILRDTGKTVKEPISDVILKEIREFGVGVIIVDQNPSLISVPALANNYTTIGMYVKHSKDISALSSAMFLDDEQKEYLGKLECGYGIVKLAGRIFTPFLVKFPHMKIKKGNISDGDVGVHMLKRGFCMEITPNQSYGSKQSQDQVLAKSAINKEETIAKTIIDREERMKEIRTLLLKDIDKYPFDGITSRNKRLSISSKKGKLAVDALIDAGIINKVEIKEADCRRFLLEITQEARKEMIERGAKHIKPLPERLGQIEHRFWNNKIGEINKKAGFIVELEKRIEGDGYIDQVISKNGKKIAIEIETGKSTPIETIKKDLELGFDRVICVATNENVYRVIRDRLEKEGLNTDYMIIIILASQYTARF